MRHSVFHVGLTAIALCAGGVAASAAWEPVRPVEFVVPAGTGGGADQMARTIQGIVTKHNLMKQPIVVINKSGGAGGEGFLDLKGSSGSIPPDLTHRLHRSIDFLRRAKRLSRSTCG
jgi:putative tricarboxylic transport membrane protein